MTGRRDDRGLAVLVVAIVVATFVFNVLLVYMFALRVEEARMPAPAPTVSAEVTP